MFVHIQYTVSGNRLSFHASIKHLLNNSYKESWKNQYDGFLRNIWQGSKCNLLSSVETVNEIHVDHFEDITLNASQICLSNIPYVNVSPNNINDMSSLSFFDDDDKDDDVDDDVDEDVIIYNPFEPMTSDDDNDVNEDDDYGNDGDANEEDDDYGNDGDDYGNDEDDDDDYGNDDDDYGNDDDDYGNDDDDYGNDGDDYGNDDDDYGNDDDDHGNDNDEDDDDYGNDGDDNDDDSIIHNPFEPMAISDDGKNNDDENLAFRIRGYNEIQAV